MTNTNFATAKEQIDLLLKNERLPHAIMIEGSNEEKNTELINYIASAAVCEGLKNPCNLCNQCRKAQAGIHSDIEFIKTSGVLKSFSVDAIRKIRDDVNIFPNETQYKVYILNGADQMSIGAQNALLKVLEEPPGSVIFILSVKSSLSLLATIRSRMTVFKIDNDMPCNAQEDLSDLIRDLSEALFSTKEFDVLRITAPFVKDKQTLKKVFTELISKLRNTYTSIVSENKKDNSEFLNHLRMNQIFEIIDKLNEGIDLIDRNVNVSLISTIIFFEIRQIVFS